MTFIEDFQSFTVLSILEEFSFDCQLQSYEVTTVFMNQIRKQKLKETCLKKHNHKDKISLNLRM